MFGKVMPHRDISPARSENEFDIAGNLLGSAADDDDFPAEPATKRRKKDDAKSLEDGGFSDDDLFISAQQAAVNRKNATADKSKKKMGAFQQMGLSPELLKSILKKGYTGWSNSLYKQEDTDFDKCQLLFSAKLFLWSCRVMIWLAWRGPGLERPQLL